jgi:hypothetical protein
MDREKCPVQAWEEGEDVRGASIETGDPVGFDNTGVLL